MCELPEILEMFNQFPSLLSRKKQNLSQTHSASSTKAVMRFQVVTLGAVHFPVFQTRILKLEAEK